MAAIEQYEYYAFISYKRQDERWAKWLQKKLERYRIPVALRKQSIDVPGHLRPVFRDKTDLSGTMLNKEIENALLKSRFLIVICSPNSAKSEWVSKEIAYFSDLGRTNQIVPFIVSGEPHSKESHLECFPESLLHLSNYDEIIGINVSESGQNHAFIKLVARVLNVKFDTLWKRYHREQNVKKIILAILFIFFVAIISLWGLSYYREKLYAELMNSNHYAIKAWNALYEKDIVGVYSNAIKGLPNDFRQGRHVINEEIIDVLIESENIFPGLSPLLILKSNTPSDISITNGVYYISDAEQSIIYSLETHEPIGIIPFGNCGFIANGKYVLAQDRDSSIVYSISDLKRVLAISKKDYDVVYGPNPYEDNWIIGCQDSTLFIDPANGRIIRSLAGVMNSSNKGKNFSYNALRAFSQKGSFFFTSFEGKLLMYETKEWQKVYETRHKILPSFFSMSEDERFLVMLDTDLSKYICIDLQEDNKEIVSYDAHNRVSDFCGNYLCFATSDDHPNKHLTSHFLTVIDYTKGTIINLEHGGSIAYAGFIDEGKRILTYSVNVGDDHAGLISIWNTLSGVKENSCSIYSVLGFPTAGKINRTSTMAFLYYGSRITAAIPLNNTTGKIRAYKPTGYMHHITSNEIVAINHRGFLVYFSLKNDTHNSGYKFSPNQFLLYTDNDIYTYDSNQLTHKLHSDSQIKYISNKCHYFQTDSGIFTIPEGRRISYKNATILPNEKMATSYRALYSIPSMELVDSSEIDLKINQPLETITVASVNGKINQYNYKTSKLISTTPYPGMAKCFSNDNSYLLSTQGRYYDDGFWITPVSDRLCLRYVLVRNNQKREGHHFYSYDLIRNDTDTLEVTDGRYTIYESVNIIPSEHGFYLWTKDGLILNLQSFEHFHTDANILDILISDDEKTFLIMDEGINGEEMTIKHYNSQGCLLKTFAYPKRSYWKNFHSTNGISLEAPCYPLIYIKNGKFIVNPANNEEEPIERKILFTNSLNSIVDSTIISKYYDEINWSHRIGIKDGRLIKVESITEIIERIQLLMKDVNQNQESTMAH